MNVSAAKWPEGEKIASTWYTKAEKARDDLFLQIRDMRRAQTPVPAEMEAELERRNVGIESARAHDAPLEERHRRQVNAVKAQERKAAGVRSVDDDDENW